MFVDPGTAASVGLTALENRKKLLPLARRMRRWLLHGRVRVAIFGAGGVGKTTLAQYLSGQLSVGRVMGTYNESIGVEHFPLQGDLVCTLIVPPGQTHRRDTTWDELYRDLSKGRSCGIINVVSYGLHAFMEPSYKDVPIYTPTMTEHEFLLAYTENRRNEELAIMERLVPHIKAASGKIWMITLVTKQDIWWPNRTSIRDYYTGGTYDGYIRDIAATRGQQNFAHEYLSASLTISNVATQAGELLWPTASGYDDNIRMANLNRLLTSAVTFVKRS